MKTWRSIAIILLLFNATGALFGGWSLMMDPTGQDLHLPQDLLAHAPFKDFFIPGVVLFSLIGVFSLVAMIWTIMHWKHYSWLIISEGVLVTGWIMVQMIMIREISYLQFIFGGIGIIFFLAGWKLKT